MSTKYLKPMSLDEVSNLLNGLGRSMGLSFSDEATAEQWIGSPIQASIFIPKLQETIRLIHLARHNNDTELKVVINEIGYNRLLEYIHKASERFSD